MVYSLYFMSHRGDHIERFEPVEAPNDAEAILRASRFAGSQPLELWDRDRKVQRFRWAVSCMVTK